jgi:hypothetical protein
MASRQNEETRDLRPHAEARLAMWKWSAEYANSRFGSMGFYDSLDATRKRHCQQAVDDILHDLKENGRAPKAKP